MHTTTEHYDNPELVSKVRKELVDVLYYNDIKYNTRCKSLCKCFADSMEIVAHGLTGAASIIAFAAGVYDYQVLSFVSGSLSIGSLVLLKLSSYALKESGERTAEVNILLNKLGITEIPNVIIGTTIHEV